MIFLSGNIGDIFAVESFLNKEERRDLKTIWYGTRKQADIEALFRSLPNYPSLEHHRIAWNDFSQFWGFASKDECCQRMRLNGREAPHELLRAKDHSIIERFNDILKQNVPYNGSSFLRHKIADIKHIQLPESFVVICPYSSDKRLKERDFTAQDWKVCVEYLKASNRKGVVLNAGSDKVPSSEWIVNMTNMTTIQEAVEVLKLADGYFGIDSSLSVLAAKLFNYPNLIIKSVNQHCYMFAKCYYAPQTDFRFLVKTPFVPDDLDGPSNRVEPFCVENELNFLVPQGIGDSIWCLFKAQDLAKRLDGTKINIKIACWNKDTIESRALEFIRRFKFVNSAEMYEMPRNGNHGPVLQIGEPADANGIYRYIPDGYHPQIDSIDYVMIPNAPLERGIRLENWLPQVETNWNIMDDFVFTEDELYKADQFHEKNGPYVAFFMASLASNTTSGHNRSGLWRPEEWIDLGDKIHKKYGVNIVVTGTTWDEDYYNKSIANKVCHKKHWINCISDWPIAQTYAMLKKARFVVSYQSGIGIVAHYMGVPVAIFWRPKGNSISPYSYVSFEEGMASAWARPDMIAAKKFMPCIYGKHKVNDILEFAENNGW
jgi:ADP-heptose:LPS heptosyltransferase